MSPKDAESLVHAFITSRLHYCNALFSGLPARSISRLQYIQNSAARMLTYTKRSAHITPILFNLHWLPVSSRIISKILLLAFKSLHGLAPTYLSDLLFSIYSLSTSIIWRGTSLWLWLKDLAFHLWEGDLSLLWFLNFGTHCPRVSGQ